MYFKDVKLEFNNITWTDKADLRQTTFIILLIIFFTSLFLWIIDSILTYIVSKFI
ncbi:MAG TPA: preprotein translocase subunit SecE [Candidatus Azoamicus sp.]